MSVRHRHCAARMLVALALAAYALAGVLGHGLHALLPCADGSCGQAHTACSCGHDHCLAAAALAAANESDAPAFNRPGHDPDNCSLCALLAKINAGYAPLVAAETHGESLRQWTILPELRLPADLVLFSTARGPPTV